MKLHPHFRQNGFGLVELMVALLVGLTISFATLGVYNTTTLTINSQDVEAKTVQDGAFALGALSRHIRNAGFVDWIGSPSLQTQLLTGIDTSSYRMTNAAAVDLLATATATGVLGTDYAGINSVHGCIKQYDNPALLNNSICKADPADGISGDHSITIAYQVRQATDAGPASVLPKQALTIPNSTNTTIVQAGDCNERDTLASAASPKGAVAVNRFFLDTLSKSIKCVGNGDPSKAEVVAQNIEQLVFRYGQAQTAPVGLSSQSAAAYSGDQLLSGFAVAGAGTLWNLVTAVEICVLSVSQTAGLPAGVTQYVDCNNNTNNYTDARFRRAMKATVSLRNRIRSTQ